MKSTRVFLLFYLMAVCLVGCASKPSPHNIQWQQGVVPPKKIALMPVRNLSDSHDGVALIEKIVPKALENKGYEMAGAVEVKAVEVKAALDAAGVSTTESTWATQISKLGSAVNSDGLMFVSIEKWQNQYEQTDANARVSLLFLLYNKAGKKLWSFRQEIYKSPGRGFGYSAGDAAADILLAFADSTGDVVAGILIGIFGVIVPHTLTDMDRLAVLAMDHALNTGKSPLPNYQ